MFFVNLIALIVLLMCSALVSGAEVALFGLSATQLNEIKEGETANGKNIITLLKKPKKLLATILIANNTINIAIVLLFSMLGEYLFANITAMVFNVVSVRFILEVIVATFLILLFGEILPKIYANRNKAQFSYFMARPLRVMDVLFTPFSTPMRSTMLFIQDKLVRKKSNFGVDHLSQALELTSSVDTTKEEHKILEGIVTFGNTDTKQVMRPRIDIFALNEQMKFTEVLEEIKKNGYSRIPVFSEHMDNVLGILYVKDILPHLDRKAFTWMKLVREPYFVPENKKLDDLLLEFQEQKMHMAIVVDEYGGTSGIVTLEDIIEEIVGDISDEFDDEDLIFSRLDDHTFVFDGKTNLKDFYRVTKIEDEADFEENKGESETLAGFVLEISGGFPKLGAKVSFKEYQFVVESLDKKRLKQLKVILPNAV